LADVDTGNGAVRLAPGATHTGLETISTCAGQHLVDPEDVEGVHADPQVERVLAGRLGDILVRADTSGFQGLTGELLVLVGDKVAAEGELVDGSALATKIENTDLRVGDTAVVAGLGVGLVLAVAVAAGRTATHCV